MAKGSSVGLPRIIALATALALVAGACAGSVPTPTASSTPASSSGAVSSPSDDVASARRSDLAQLVQELQRWHPNPFLVEGEAGFMARIAAVEERALGLSDAGFLVEVMRLMGARERDGHSGAWAMAQRGDRLHAWPVWLWDFPDGLRVVAAQDEAFVGARLVTVGETPVDEARQAVEPLVPRDNESSLRANLPMYLTLPEVLDELGLRSPGGPGLTFEFLDGSERQLTADAIRVDRFHDWIASVYGSDYPTGLPPSDEGPAHLRNRSLAFWTEELPPPGGTYLGYNFVAAQDRSGRHITQLATEIETAAAEGESGQPFVIDMRNNPGGDNTTFRPLRDAVETMAAALPGRTSIIAGRSTFSAAGNFITDLMVGAHGDTLRLVGEPPGGGLNIYGDVRVVTLRSSGIVVLISRRYHERAPGDDRLQIEPDVPVELTWEDHASGRDPVLEAALGG